MPKPASEQGYTANIKNNMDEKFTNLGLTDSDFEGLKSSHKITSGELTKDKVLKLISILKRIDLFSENTSLSLALRMKSDDVRDVIIQYLKSNKLV